MGNQKLCQECWKYLKNKYGDQAYNPPWQHCHHPNNGFSSKSEYKCLLKNPEKECLDFKIKMNHGWCKDCLYRIDLLKDLSTFITEGKIKKPPCKWCATWIEYKAAYEIYEGTPFGEAVNYLIGLGGSIDKCPICGVKL